MPWANAARIPAANAAIVETKDLYYTAILG